MQHRSLKGGPARAGLLGLGAAGLLLAAGCAPPPQPLPVPQPPPVTVVEAPRIAVPASGVALVIHKGTRRLEVYRDGSMEREFPVVFGPRPEGRKRFQGDMRTPEGLYHVTELTRHKRWQFFIGIDYPNVHDERAYARDLAAGLIPVIDGDRVPIGSGLGIHGNDRPAEQVNGIDWTRGCVAMRNSDVRDLFRLVSVGTPVLFIP